MKTMIEDGDTKSGPSQEVVVEPPDNPINVISPNPDGCISSHDAVHEEERTSNYARMEQNTSNVDLQHEEITIRNSVEKSNEETMMRQNTHDNYDLEAALRESALSAYDCDADGIEAAINESLSLPNPVLSNVFTDDSDLEAAMKESLFTSGSLSNFGNCVTDMEAAMKESILLSSGFPTDASSYDSDIEAAVRESLFFSENDIHLAESESISHDDQIKQAIGMSVAMVQEREEAEKKELEESMKLVQEKMQLKDISWDLSLNHFDVKELSLSETEIDRLQNEGFLPKS